MTPGASTVKERLHQRAAELGLTVRVAGAEPFAQLAPILQQRRERGLVSPWEAWELARRIDPALTLPGVRSVVVAAWYYGQQEMDEPQGLRGFVARSARGPDYHRVMGQKLAQLASFLQQELPGVRGKVLIDTGPLSERALAHRAGLGWLGKNCSLFLPGSGSWLVLGEILLDVYLEPDYSLPSRCGACSRCLEACPTGALLGPGEIDPKRCLSYLTQARGFLPRELRPFLERRIYGCDTCQEACPHNHRPGDGQPEHPWTPEQSWPELAGILALDKAGFQREWASTAAGWRGNKILQRNAVVALGNSGSPDALPLLARAVEDPSPIVRGHAAWALGCLGGKEARRLLAYAWAKETDPRVQAELADAQDSTGKS